VARGLWGLKIGTTSTGNTRTRKRELAPARVYDSHQNFVVREAKGYKGWVMNSRN